MPPAAYFMASKWLPPAELTASGRPVLQPGEVECFTLSSVDLETENNPTLPPLRSGLLILTTHRLLWIPNATAPPIATFSVYAAGIPLKSVSHIFSMKKSIKSIFASPKVRFQVFTTPEGKLDVQGSSSTVITLVLRGKSDPDAFLVKLWEAWSGRAWENSRQEGPSDSNSVNLQSIDGCSTGGRFKMPVVGVAGILRKEQEIWENTDKSLQEAFQDMNALMSKAKEMMMLAEKMRLKLLSGSSNQASGLVDDELGSKEEMQNWLLSVGIISPVTKESAGALYHQQLSRQLADFVKSPLERAGGMINLIDIYCLFNRARGTELISPDDLLQACSIWEKFDVPVMLRKFDSGVMVIQNKSHSDEEVLSRIKALVLKPCALKTGISASDAAMILGIAPGMAKEHLLNAESKGLLCRDVSPDGFRFYVNLFQEINLDDLHLLQAYGVYSSWVGASIVASII
ncbi:vacuolar protein sorting-associated protein 36 [Impatiens glandulifera]|uniref:vacuolar protein sorting-associated protein 36 n=1 Tax=Impatiens glandulifera TaxID=253017 RepID=UPI001FB143E2|nr:vacuolar protein sorting-associated protein 36 [Impatiens glandulifera]